ncbi:MAG: MaoC/PaaZ C-terminal domain-containing protein [Aeromicrobium sp.]
MSDQLYADDLPIGEVIDLGKQSLTHDDIVSFAEQWDPQAFHVDDVAARAGFFGEVIASGLQTMGVLQRLAVLGAFHRWHIIAGRSIRDVQLTLAVRAGMQLHGTIEITAAAPVDISRSLVTLIGRLDHEGQPVLRMETDTYVRRRP